MAKKKMKLHTQDTVAFGAMMDIGLLRKSASFLLKSSQCRHIVVLFWQGEKSGLRLVTFHLCIKDHRPKTEAEQEQEPNREQSEPCPGGLILSVLMSQVIPPLPPTSCWEGNNSPESVHCREESVSTPYGAHAHTHSSVLLDRYISVVILAFDF